MRLSELRTGDKGVIVKVMGRGAFRKRIIEMGFIRGKEVIVIQNAPLKDPIHYRVMGYDVSLRRSDAVLIEVVISRRNKLPRYKIRTGVQTLLSCLPAMNCKPSHYIKEKQLT